MPEFTTFTIESVDEISAIYYQLDGHGSTGWTPIETGYSDTIWNGLHGVYLTQFGIM